jgi:hypothetical protein
VLAEWAAEVAVVHLAHDLDRHAETIRLGRAIDPALAFGLQWAAWEATLMLVLDSAKKSGDQEAEAWALHELGTRKLCTDNRPAAEELLKKVLDLRQKLGDVEGAAVTERNLWVALKPTVCGRKSGSTAAFCGYR